ncbi:hypothetical protein [Halanaerobaculum tunisiense]
MLEIRDQKIEIDLVSLESSVEVANRVQNVLLDWLADQEQGLKSQDIEWLPVVSFILGTVTSGFLKSIGSEIWQGVKDFLYSKKRDNPNLEFKFNYQGVKVVAKLDNNDPQIIKTALSNLDDLITVIVNNREVKRLKLILDNTGKWQVRDFN